MINTTLMETLRESRNLTKYRMCKKLNMSTQSYYDIIKRKTTTIKTLDKIAKILNVSPKELIQ
jgi:transcriptional regulator with XRE-family HTH domain